MPWYTPDHLQSGFAQGDAEAPWEGIGTGWFHSVLGGGQRLGLRPSNTPSTKFAVTEDNALPAVPGSFEPKRVAGDFAVPTLFNGNFDAGNTPGWSPKNSTLPISGWGLYNGSAADAQQGQLRTWNEIATESTAFRSHLDKLGSSTFGSNFALKLTDGQSITHNPFVVTDWGALRFDLHTGDVASSSSNKLKVTLRSLDGSEITKEITLEEARGTAGEYDNDRWRVGYGETGFETFTVDIPDEWRGKVATLEFKLTGGSPVYLDNVFFKSQHLMLGNPTEARHLNAPVPLPYANNYLLEKAQYATSYSGDGNIPNWSSWQVNSSWFIENNTLPRPQFQPDVAAPFYPVKHSDYAGQKMPDDYPIERGHLAPSADRNRNKKDNIATYLTSNIVPQHTQNNSPLWSGLEDFERQVASLGKELYVFAGSYGTLSGKNFIDVDGDPAHSVAIPEALWKVLVVVDRPGLGIGDINAANTTAFAVYLPNTEPLLTGQTSPKYKKWFEGYTPGVGGAEILTVRELEQRLNSDSRNTSRGINYNFLSNLSDHIQLSLETRPFTWVGDDPINAFSGVPLLAEQADSLVLNAHPNSVTSSETTVLHPSVLKNGSFQVGSFQVGSFQVGSFQVGSFQVSSFQVGSSQIATPQIRSAEISSNQDSSLKTTLVQTNAAEVGATQIGSISKELIKTGSAL